MGNEIVAVIGALFGVVVGFEIGSQGKCKQSEALKLPAWVGNEQLATIDEPEIVAPKPIAIPPNVLDYCQGEAEEWAQDSCLERAKESFANTGDWNTALARVQRQDGEVK